MMVACIGLLATIRCKPRQAWKGAAVAVNSGAEVRLVQATTLIVRLIINYIEEAQIL